MKTYSRKKSSYLKKAFVGSNFNEMCRLCLSEVDAILTPIIEDEKISYQEWIQYSVDVLVEEGDGLPSNICKECLATVEQMYLFKKKCKASDSKLREHLELIEITEECKLSNIGFNDASYENNLFQNEEADQRKCDESNAVDSGGTADKLIIRNEVEDGAEEEEEEEKEEVTKKDEEVTKDKAEEEMLADSSSRSKEEESKDGGKDASSMDCEGERKMVIKEIKRYILRGEKKEGDQEEDLTDCEVIPLDFREDESVEYSSENSQSPPRRKGEPSTGNETSAIEETSNETSRIREIYKLWENEEDGVGAGGGGGEDAEETQKDDEDVVILDVLWNENSGRESPKDKNYEVLEVDLEENGSVQTHRVYTNKNQIRIIETMPRQAKWFNCFACTEQFTSYRALKNHLATAHEDVSDAPCCETCGKHFTCANSLKRHMAVHTGFKPYKCKICERKFSQGSILKRHVLTHEPLKPFNCHICQKSYTQKMNLVSHLKNHGFRTGVESFRCKLCSKSFVHQSGLSRHVKLHKGIRFLCVHCKKSFGDASALARHVKSIHVQQQQVQQRQHPSPTNVFKVLGMM